MTQNPENVPSVDQGDRQVPINLRQSGPTPVELLISTRVRKSPFWHLSVEAGCWRATIYNRTYHPRGYVRPEAGGPMAEYDSLVNGVTLWDVAVERQIRVRGPGAEDFVNFVITRDASRIPPMAARYCILCNEQGGILNDPVLLRPAQDEFWFSIADTDLMLWLQAVNLGRKWDVDIEEIDVCPVQIQGPTSENLMADLVGDAIREVPYYGLMEAEIGGVPVIVSQSGFTGEKGYEIYVRNASLHAEKVWSRIREVGVKHGLAVIAPAHHRRIAAGILSWGQDMDFETSPFQVNLGYQVPRGKRADYIGKAELERQRSEIDAGRFPFKLKMVGLRLGGRPITDYAPRLLAGRRAGWGCGRLCHVAVVVAGAGNQHRPRPRALRALRARHPAGGPAARTLGGGARPARRSGGVRGSVPAFREPERTRGRAAARPRLRGVVAGRAPARHGLASVRCRSRSAPGRIRPSPGSDCPTPCPRVAVATVAAFVIAAASSIGAASELLVATKDWVIRSFAWLFVFVGHPFRLRGRAPGDPSPRPPATGIRGLPTGVREPVLVRNAVLGGAGIGAPVLGDRRADPAPAGEPVHRGGRGPRDGPPDHGDAPHGAALGGCTAGRSTWWPGSGSPSTAIATTGP